MRIRSALSTESDLNCRNKAPQAAAGMGEYARGMDEAADATERNTRTVNSNSDAMERNGRIREEGTHGSRLTRGPGSSLFPGTSGGTFTTITRGAYIGADGKVYYS